MYIVSNMIITYYFTGMDQVMYAMVLRPPFSKRVLHMIKILTDGRSVDLICGNFS